MTNHTTKNLLFLLASAPMALGSCIVLTDDSSSDETDGNGDGDGDPGDGDGDGTPGDGDGTPGDGDGTPGDGDGAPGDGDGDNDLCTTYAAHYDECLGTDYYDDNVEFCEYLLTEFGEYYGDECVAAVEAMFACLNSLDCTAFDPSSCPAELAAIGEACNEEEFIAKLELAHKP